MHLCESDINHELVSVHDVPVTLVSITPVLNNQSIRLDPDSSQNQWIRQSQPKGDVRDQSEE
eukprot:3865474-Amphidinium_carterae.1